MNPFDIMFRCVFRVYLAGTIDYFWIFKRYEKDVYILVGSKLTDVPT